MCEMKIAFRALFLIFPLLSLSGCLDVSHPFSDVGSQARRLTQQNLPPARLAVPIPVPENKDWRNAEALWAQEVEVALLGQSIPAVLHRPYKNEWWIRLGVVRDIGGIKPYYDLVDPTGKVRFHGVNAVMSEADWVSANPDALNIMALDMAPKISDVLTGIQARMMEGDPQSLVNRPAKIYFRGVHGAPGDGNIALVRSFYLFIVDGRNQIQDTPKNADYSVFTEVALKTLPPNKVVINGKHVSVSEQSVSIIWHVTTMDGKEIGAATQLHDVPAHSLDKIWGDAAPAAAQQAAEAVKTIITNYSGRDHKPLEDVVIDPKLLSQEQADTHYIDGAENKAHDKRNNKGNAQK